MSRSSSGEYSYTHPKYGTVLRTPDSRFQNLPGFPYQPRYFEYNGLRVHYLDEGDMFKQNVFLCLHGEPSWSYLYRKMIPIFSEEGRVICPDFIGFGRSDKIVDGKHYSFNFHREMLVYLINFLDLKNITLVCQDWGGLLGLTLPVEFEDRFTRLIVMNTGLGTGDIPLGKGFLAWREFVRTNPNFDIGKLMKRSTSILTDKEMDAYNAPFPDDRYKGGARTFPSLVPDNPNAEGTEISRKSREFWSKKMEWIELYGHW